MFRLAKGLMSSVLVSWGFLSLVFAVSFRGAAVAQFGNRNSCEVGDAVYCKLPPPYSLSGYNHAGIFVGQDKGTLKVVEVKNLSTQCVRLNDFSSSFSNLGADYFGAYTLSPSSQIGMGFDERRKVALRALWFYTDTDLSYTASVPLKFSGSVPVQEGNITHIRCDGLVEYCYEKYGLKVWWNVNYQAGNDWSILYHPEYHSTPFYWSGGPDVKLTPWAQRGAPGSSPGNSWMDTPAWVKPPELGDADSRRFRDAVKKVDLQILEVEAKDESGIGRFHYRKSSSTSWSYAPWEHMFKYEQADEDILISSAGTYLWTCEDNAGNVQVRTKSMSFFRIDATSGTGGSLPVVAVVEKCGDQASVSAAASPGYAVDTWYLNGQPHQRGGSWFHYTENSPVQHALHVTFKVTRPDLSVPRATLANVNPIAGKSYSATIDVKNQGDRAAGTSSTGAYISVNNTVSTGDRLIASINTPGIDPGKIYKISKSVIVPASMSSGNYWFGAVADTAGAVFESDEGNNASIGQAITVVQPPVGMPGALVSTSHSPSKWSSLGGISFSWTTAGGGAGGIAGYAYALTKSQSSSAPTVLNLGAASTTVGPLTVATSAIGYWFHIRAQDNQSNWGPVAKLGPFLVDRAAPSDPRALSASSGHQVSTWSRVSRISAAWTASTDPHSGLAGYSVQWDQTPTGSFSSTLNGTSTSSQSPVLPSCTQSRGHFLHVQARDAVGNWSVMKHLGPFLIDWTVPLLSAMQGPGQVVSGMRVPLTCTFSDAHSGVSAVELREQGGTWVTFPAVQTPVLFTVSKLGTTTIEGRVRDKAGNVSAVRQVQVQTASGPPAISSHSPSVGLYATGTDTVIVNGTNLGTPQNTSVKVDSRNVTPSGHTSTQITFDLGATIDGPGDFLIEVANSQGADRVLVTRTNPWPISEGSVRMDSSRPDWSSGASASCDVDQDGQVEIIFTDFSSVRTPDVLRASESGLLAVQPNPCAGISGQYRQVRVGDLDRDGFPDLVLFRDVPTGHVMEFWRNESDGAGGRIFRAWSIGLPGIGNFPADATLHDYDGDGWTDIVVCERTGTTPVQTTLVGYQNVPGGSGVSFKRVNWFPSPVATSGFPYHVFKMAWDVGAEDDLVVGGDFGVKVYRREPGASPAFEDLSPLYSASALGFIPSMLEFLDFDGDGVRDLIAKDSQRPTVVTSFRYDSNSHSLVKAAESTLWTQPAPTGYGQSVQLRSVHGAPSALHKVEFMFVDTGKKESEIFDVDSAGRITRLEYRSGLGAYQRKLGIPLVLDDLDGDGDDDIVCTGNTGELLLFRGMARQLRVTGTRVSGGSLGLHFYTVPRSGAFALLMLSPTSSRLQVPGIGLMRIGAPMVSIFGPVSGRSYDLVMELASYPTPWQFYAQVVEWPRIDDGVGLQFSNMMPVLMK
jgi:hypothetical protein